MHCGIEGPALLPIEHYFLTFYTLFYVIGSANSLSGSPDTRSGVVTEAKPVHFERLNTNLSVS